MLVCFTSMLSPEDTKAISKEIESSKDEILEAINKFADHMEVRFDKVDGRLDNVEGRLDGMVTKTEHQRSLDVMEARIIDRIDGGVAKTVKTVELLREKKVFTPDEADGIISLPLFVQKST